MKKFFFSLVSFSAMAMLSACDDSDDSYAVVDGLAPVINMDATILAEPGRSFTIEGVITDNDGISTIRLTNETFYLDKTIDLIEIKNELLTSYNLAYRYTPDASFAETDKFPLTITVTDVLGNQTTKTINVQMNGDFTAPSFSVAPSDNVLVLLKEETKMKVGFTAIDDKALKSVVISIPDLDYNKEITKFENAKKLVYKEYITIPSEVATYNMTIELTDTVGFTTSKQSVITVSELVDFEKMYLSDVETADELNSDLFGVPMLIDHGEEPFTYVAHYYASKKNQGIRFVPQKTDFDPICFAADVDDDNILGNSFDATNEIILPEVGYYEIKLNTLDATYSVEKWTPTTEVMTMNGTTTINFNDGSGDQPAQLCLAGEGLPDTPNWSTNQNDGAFILTQDTTNPYQFYAEMKLEQGTNIQFTISQTHWWGWWPEPYWRFESGENDSKENEYNTRNGGNNMTTVTVSKTGKYRFEFDTALLRSKIILVD